jgi:hypothetical protein
MLREDGMLLVAERKARAPKTPDRITLLERRVAALEQIIGNGFDRPQASQQEISPRALELEIEKLKSPAVGEPVDQSQPASEETYRG